MPAARRGPAVGRHRAGGQGGRVGSAAVGPAAGRPRDDFGPLLKDHGEILLALSTIKSHASLKDPVLPPCHSLAMAHILSVTFSLTFPIFIFPTATQITTLVSCVYIHEHIFLVTWQNINKQLPSFPLRQSDYPSEPPFRLRVWSEVGSGLCGWGADPVPQSGGRSGAVRGRAGSGQDMG